MLLEAVLIYISILLLLFIFPWPLQSFTMYLHWVRFPLFVDFKKGGEAFGFRSESLKTIKIETSDGLSLSAWHVIPRQAQGFVLKDAKIVFLYFHGNAGTRATPHRVATYKILTSYSIESHVIALDYRGFADSERAIPSEATFGIDALSSFDYIVNEGVKPSNIVIVGHSLGSGIAAELALKTSRQGRPCGGLILMSGYTSIADAAIGYPRIPLLRVFHGTPMLEDWVKKRVMDKLESHKKLGFVKVPVLLIHGAKDRDIRPWQAKANFLEALGERIGRRLVSEKYWDVRETSFKLKEEKEMVITTLEGEEGELWKATNGLPLWLLLVKHATHNDLAIHHVVHDVIEDFVKSLE